VVAVLALCVVSSVGRSGAGARGVDHARHDGARYIVADGFSVVRLRPQLEPMGVPGFSHPELDLVWEERLDGRTTRIFAVEPAPPDGRPMGPPPGFVGDGC
jgi:hypothetical protein